MTSAEVGSPFTDFPADFLWGSATAGHQVEGGNVNTDWWVFEHDPTTPARESSGDGIDHLNRFAGDFELLASLRHNAHRFSVEWACIEPAEGEFSRAALDHYGRVLDALHSHRLIPFLTLHHFTLPRWFAERGGWLAPDALAVFDRYCRVVLKFLGERTRFVCTINEPQMVALHGYLEGYHPPGRTSHVLWKRVGRILLDAHRVAVRAVHDLCDAKPGLAVQLPLLVPARDDPASRAFCAELEAEIVDLYLDGLVGPDRGDWLGVQYYRKQWVDPASPTFFAPPPAGTHVTQMGWAVHPDGLRHMLQLAGARTGLPLYVTENGIATEDDRERIDYLESHLRAVARARREGVDVRGYLHWSAFDNFEWSEGYRPKFGLIAVDRTDGYRRTPKSSALALARVAASGRIDALRA
jgi:beta-glucosidase